MAFRESVELTTDPLRVSVNVVFVTEKHPSCILEMDITACKTTESIEVVYVEILMSKVHPWNQRRVSFMFPIRLCISSLNHDAFLTFYRSARITKFRFPVIY